MSRALRLLTCVVLVLGLVVAPAALASPVDDSSLPWWTAFSALWTRVLAAGSGDDGTNRGPYMDPDGTSLSDSDDDGGNRGPYIDPNGLTVLPHDRGNYGPYRDPKGFNAGAGADYQPES